MPTFASLLPADAITPSPRALSVVLLDLAGVDPEAIRAGVTVIACDSHVVDYVADAIDHLVFAGQTDTPTWEEPSSVAPAHLLAGRVDDRKFTRAVAFGKPVVVVCAPSHIPDGADIQADRTYTVKAALTDAIVASVIRIVTGDEVECAGFAAPIDTTTLLATARPGLSGFTVVERLRAIVAKHAADDAEDEAKREEALAAVEKIATPVPLATAAQAVVTRLSDLSGYGAAKDWGLQLASDLRDYREGRLSWADVDKGILLTSPPGGGKSFYAKALAAECNVPLVVTTYNDWHGGASSGDTVQRSLTKLFSDWRKKSKNGPLIVFWDEADSIGRRGADARADYWFGPIINSWLAFLDGADGRSGIIVVAATNFPDKCDPALLRPGRLERIVAIPPLDMASIPGVLLHHVPDLVGDLDDAARACRGRTPAQIAMICREARRSARRERMPVAACHVEAAVAASRPARDDDTDGGVCRHEAAHAVAAVVLGVTLCGVDADDPHARLRNPPFPTLDYAKRSITVTLAGRRADAMLGHGVDAGSEVDLAQATNLARSAVAHWGLTGRVYRYDQDEATLSPEVRADVQELLDFCDLGAAKLVDQHRDAILRVADALRRQRYLDGEGVAALVREASPSPA